MPREIVEEVISPWGAKDNVVEVPEGGGGGGTRPSEYDFSDVDSNDTFTETVGSGTGAVTTTYEVTRDSAGRITRITNLTDGWETEVDWGSGSFAGDPNLNLAAPYDPTATYTKDAYCIHDGVLYKSNTNIILAEVWTAAHWDRVLVTSEYPNTPEAIGALAADGTAVNAYRLEKSNLISGAAGWYQFLVITLSNGKSLTTDLLIADTYSYPVGILRVFFNRNSTGGSSVTVRWLSTNMSADRVRWSLSSGTLTLFFNKSSNTAGRVSFTVLSAYNRSGEDVDLSSMWGSTAVAEPTTATPATGDSKLQTGTITLSATWSGSGPYYQTVTVTGPTITGKSKVDIQLTAAQIASLISDGVSALLVENNAGTLTAYAVGAAPSSAMTLQCTVEETV